MNKLSKNIVFFIGARGGSRGLKDKNLKKIQGRSLLSITINQIKRSNFYSKLIVSSDSKKIINEAKKNKVDFIIKRPKFLSMSATPKFDVWKHTVNFYEKKTGSIIDILVDLDCTNPLRNVEDIDRIIKKKISYNKVDAVVCFSEARKNPYFNMLELTKNNLLKISKKIKKLPTRRQDAPKVFEQVASIYCLEKNFIKKKKNLYEGKVKGHLIKNYQSFDIDDKFDFDLVKYIYKKYKFD